MNMVTLIELEDGALLVERSKVGVTLSYEGKSSIAYLELFLDNKEAAELLAALVKQESDTP